jgi:putative transposase
MKYPSELYKKSDRIYKGLPDLDYPLHDKTIFLSSCGRVCVRNKKIHISQVFAEQSVGISEVNDGIWLVSFMDYDLGYFDEDSRRFEPLENPFKSKVLPMSPV